MRELAFGQPDDGIIQLGYVVPDLAEAMSRWTRQLRAGPWFTLERIAGENPVYRGAPTTALCDIALGFAGHMQIELIQPCDREPSVYREMLDRTGYGFHHFGVAAVDIDREAARLAAEGYDLAFTAAVPSGGRVAYFDTRGALPGMIELLEADPPLETLFGAMYSAATQWDGADPVRPMTALRLD